MPTRTPSRRWCREVLLLRRAAGELLASGTPLTDPRVLALSQRLDRLMLVATPHPGGLAARASAGRV
jgi:hypothetical protein